MLENILNTKGVSEKIEGKKNKGMVEVNRPSSLLKHNYMESENLCPAFRRNQQGEQMKSSCMSRGLGSRKGSAQKMQSRYR
jgi:hypothetical protein